MTTIKAIETAYKGYRFRSRLEARWAVFFDALGIEWQYEPEGFELPDGGRYLPDFFLPRFSGGLWVEVKPHGDKADKAVRFAMAGPEHNVLILDGPPDFRVYRLLFSAKERAPEMPEDYLDEASCCFYGKYLPGGVNGDEYRLYYEPGYENDDGSIDRGYVDAFVGFAVNAARSARFEHGECGAPA